MLMMAMSLARPQLKSLDKKIASLKVESCYTQGDEGTTWAAGIELHVLEKAHYTPLTSPTRISPIIFNNVEEYLLASFPSSPCSTFPYMVKVSLF